MKAHPLYLLVLDAYRNQFGQPPEAIVHAPGRMNLIGEHTDYNHGFVFPAAIAQGIWFALGSSGGTQHAWKALDTHETVSVSGDDIRPMKGWAGYLQGACHILKGRIPASRSTQCVFTSDLPVGAGLSSSSALTSGFLLGLNILFNLQQTRESLAWLAHLVEHDFIGLQGGIMDQHASLLCVSDHFLFLDCLDRSYAQVPFSPEKSGIQIFLINTGVQHTLTDTDYNTRSSECRSALNLLREAAGIETLREIMDLDLGAYAELLGPVLLRRLQFVKAENQRVLDAREALSGGLWERLGDVLNASHAGLRDDYQVSCPELDFLADYAQNEAHILGSRMMGGGFGGCTINLCQGAPDEAFLARMKEAYRMQFNLDAGFIPVRPSAGASAYRISDP